jgi:hypothetical protein
MDQLQLDPSVNSTTGRLVYLHDIENALSNLVASVFWIGTYQPFWFCLLNHSLEV